MLAKMVLLLLKVKFKRLENHEKIICSPTVFTFFSF